MPLKTRLAILYLQCASKRRSGFTDVLNDSEIYHSMLTARRSYTQFLQRISYWPSLQYMSRFSDLEAILKLPLEFLHPQTLALSCDKHDFNTLISLAYAAEKYLGYYVMLLCNVRLS